jgi:16S rRNA (guanine527-N7)-methyltransferase
MNTATPTAEALAAVRPYFPDLAAQTWERLALLIQHLQHWNTQINLVSRQDIHQLVPRHLVPSLAFSRILQLQAGDSLLDVGTGGGFPGLPLAIAHPEVEFTLLDAVGKKLRAVHAIAQALGLRNVTVHHGRIESYHGRHTFVTGRSVKAFPIFRQWVRKNLAPTKAPRPGLAGGIAYLSGYPADPQLSALGLRIFPLAEVFNHHYCLDKCLLYEPR